MPASYGTTAYTPWAPVFFNLLFAASIVVLFGALTADRRRVWLGVWIFASVSWVGQDYFSPQGFCYFLFLVVLGIVLWWFRLPAAPDETTVRRVVRSQRLASLFVSVMRRGDAGSRRYPDAGRGERAAMLLLVVLLSTVVAASHQLTPMMLILALGVLVDDRQNLVVHEAAGGLPHPFLLVGEKTLESHVVGQFGGRRHRRLLEAGFQFN